MSAASSRNAPLSRQCMPTVEGQPSTPGPSSGTAPLPCCWGYRAVEVEAVHA